MATSPRRSSREKTFAPVGSVFKSLFFDVKPVLGKASKLRQICSGPNIFEANDWLSELEVNRLLANTPNTASTSNRSSVDGPAADESVVTQSEQRNSCTTFIPTHSQISRAIVGRAADQLGIPSTDAEPIQVVSYSEGQHFGLHHDIGTLDTVTGEVQMVTPRRLATVFLYLNHLPLGIGHTCFPHLKNSEGKQLTVNPVRGKALIFPNILPDGSADKRTAHFADVIPFGIEKYGANLWLTDCRHNIDFVKPKPNKSQRIPAATNVTLQEWTRAAPDWIGTTVAISLCPNTRAEEWRVHSYTEKEGWTVKRVQGEITDLTLRRQKQGEDISPAPQMPGEGIVSAQQPYHSTSARSGCTFVVWQGGDDAEPVRTNLKTCPGLLTGGRDLQGGKTKKRRRGPIEPSDNSTMTIGFHPMVSALQKYREEFCVPMD
jgi:hypothetical protein